MSDVHKRAIPQLSGTAFRHRLAPGTSGLLWLRRPEKDARPLSAVLAALDRTGEDEIAFVGGNFRAIPSKHHRDYTTAEIERVIDDKQAPSAFVTVVRPFLSVPIWVIGTLVSALSDLGGKADRAPALRSSDDSQGDEKTRSHRMRETTKGKAVDAKRRVKLYSGAIYSGAISTGEGDSSLLAHDLAMEVAHALTPAEQIDHEQVVSEPADLRDAVAGTVGRTLDPQLILSASEIASLFHPPDGKTHTHSLSLTSTAFPLIDAPNWMPSAATRHELPADVIPIGEVQPKTKDARVVGMRIKDWVGHLLITGITRVGKSTWIELFLSALIRSSIPVFSIDPNKTTNDGLLELLAAENPELLRDSNRLAHIDYTDSDYLPYLQTLSCETDDQVEIAVSDTKVLMEAEVGSLKELSRAEGVFDGGTRALALANQAIKQHARARGDDPEEREQANLFDLGDLLTDREFFDLVAPFLTPFLRKRFARFWAKEKRERELIAETLLHRLDTMANNPHLAYIISSPYNRIRFDEAIKAGRSEFHSLDIQSPHAQVVKVLTPVLFVRYLREAAALWRNEGSPTGDAVRMSVMALDEVHNVAKLPLAADALALALAQIAKAGPRLLLATQFLGQMREAKQRVRDEMRTNAANRVAFRLPVEAGTEDVQRLDPSGKVLSAADLAQFPRYHAAANFDLHNPRSGAPEQTGAFTFHSIDTDRPRKGHERFGSEIAPLLELVNERSRRQFCRTRAQAEEEARLHDERLRAELRKVVDELGESAAARLADDGDLSVDSDDQWVEADREQSDGSSDDLWA